MQSIPCLGAATGIGRDRKGIKGNLDFSVIFEFFTEKVYLIWLPYLLKTLKNKIQGESLEKNIQIDKQVQWTVFLCLEAYHNKG